MGQPEHELTHLLLTMAGYSILNPETFDSEGFLALVDKDLRRAAGWSFLKLLEIWNNKHERAVYVHAKRRQTPSLQFHFYPEVLICEGADFTKVLKSLADGVMYLDPACKAEGWGSDRIKTKRRNQFRIPMKSISSLYQKSKLVSVGDSIVP